MLPTELAFRLQPVAEKSLRGGVQQGWPEGYVSIPLCFIVAVEGLQHSIELRSKLVQRGRGDFELNQPFMSAVAVFAEIDGCHGIVPHDSARPHGGEGDGPVRIVYDELFAKRVDVMFQTAHHADAERIESGEADGIPQQVAPEPPLVLITNA